MRAILISACLASTLTSVAWTLYSRSTRAEFVRETEDRAFYEAMARIDEARRRPLRTRSFSVQDGTTFQGNGAFVRGIERLAVARVGSETLVIVSEHCEPSEAGTIIRER